MRRLCAIVGLFFSLLCWATASGGTYVTLRSHAIAFHISVRTGALAGSGKVLAPCFDRYTWQDNKAEKKGTERGDRVISLIRSPGGRSATFVCMNSATGLKITKHYRLQGNPVRLLKTDTFTGERGIVRYEPVVNANEHFRRESYYYRFSFWVYGNPSPRIECRQVRRDTPIIEPGVIMVNPKQNVVLAAYFHAVNGHILMPQEEVSVGINGGVFKEPLSFKPPPKAVQMSNGWLGGVIKKWGHSYILQSPGRWHPGLLTPTGWRMVMANAVSPECGHSFTVAYEIRAGNEFDYNLAMARRPSTLAQQGPEPTGWGAHIAWRSAFDIGLFKNKHAMAALAAAADRTPWGGVGTSTWWGWFAPYYGDYASREKDAAQGTENPAKIAAQIREMEHLSPKLKIGLYVLPGMLNKSSKAAETHPDWILYGRDGKPRVGSRGDYAPENPTYSWRIGASGVLDYWRDRIRGIMANLKAQYIYLDGGVGNGSAGFPDWRTYSVGQQYQWRTLWRSVQKITHKYGGVVLCNAPVSVYDDGGFLECDWFPNYRQNWKYMADRITEARIWTRPGNSLSMAGYEWSGDIHDPATRLEVDWWFIFGLTPDFLASHNNMVAAINSTFSYIAADYELRSRVIVQAHVRPAWEDQGVNVEVHAQKVPGGGMLSIMNHAGHPEKYNIQADLRPLGLTPGRPLYAWVYNMRPLDKPGQRLLGPARLRQCFNTRLLRFTVAAPARFAFNDWLPEGLAQLVVLTRSPALVYEVAGQECPLALPSTLGISTSGVLSPGRLDLLVRTGKPGRLLAVIPNKWSKVSGMIRPVGWRGVPEARASEFPVHVETMYGSKVAVLAFPGHDSYIVLKKLKK